MLWNTSHQFSLCRTLQSNSSTLPQIKFLLLLRMKGFEIYNTLICIHDHTVHQGWQCVCEELKVHTFHSGWLPVITCIKLLQYTVPSMNFMSLSFFERRQLKHLIIYLYRKYAETIPLITGWMWMSKNWKTLWKGIIT